MCAVKILTGVFWVALPIEINKPALATQVRF